MACDGGMGATGGQVGNGALAALFCAWLMHEVIFNHLQCSRWEQESS